MSRVQRTGIFAGLFFLVGMLSANFISPTLRSQQAQTDAAFSDSLSTNEELTPKDDVSFIPVLPVLDVDQNVFSSVCIDPPSEEWQPESIASFDTERPELQTDLTSVAPESIDPPTAETNADLQFALLTAANDTLLETVSAKETNSGERRGVVSERIEAHFPQLPEHVRRGWVDTYLDMPLDELDNLLEQKKLMPSILPLTSFMSGSADHDYSSNIEILSTRQTAADTFAVARATILHNLKNALTAGYRRQHVVMVASTLESTSESQNISSCPTAFDMTTGRIQQSHDNLHLAIEGDSNAMFRLEPGCVLTRCGQFKRLSDGHIGVTVGNVDLALSGLDVVPDDAVHINILDDGTVQYSQNKVVHTAGKIELFNVDSNSLSGLSSKNGVYFSVPADQIDSVLITARNASLTSRAFEGSNVDINTEWQLYDHLERLNAVR